MDGVERRVVQRIVAERKRLHAEQVVLVRRQVSLEKALTRVQVSQDALLLRLREGAHLRDSELARYGVLAHRLVCLVRERSAVNRRLAQAASELGRLDSADEFARRMAFARRLGGEVLAGPAAARVLLERCGGPMRAKEIARALLDAGVVDLNGATPEQTISAYLAKAAKRGDEFVRVSRGVYDLARRT
jgi:hypothetical protein